MKMCFVFDGTKVKGKSWEGQEYKMIISSRKDLSERRKVELLVLQERKIETERQKLIELEQEVIDVLHRDIENEMKERKADIFVVKQEVEKAVHSGFPSIDQRRTVHPSFGDWLSWKRNRVHA